MLPAIIGLALVLRLSLLLLNIHSPYRFLTPDSPSYLSVAGNLHEAYFDPNSPLFGVGLLRTPGYPSFITAVSALSGGGLLAVILSQVAVGVLTVWLTYLLAFRLFGPLPARLAAMALAVDPISIVLANYVQPEVLFSLLLVAGALAWVRGLQEHSRAWAMVAGIAFGIGVLVRPVGVYLPVVLLPASWFLHGGAWTKRLVFAGSLFLAFAIPVGGWIVHNAQMTGVPILSTAEGVNLLLNGAAGALAENEGLSLAEARSRLKRSVDERAGPDLNEAEVSRIATSVAMETLLRYPMGTVKTWFKGVGRMLLGPGRLELLRLVGVTGGPLAVVLVGLEFLVLAAILAGGAWGILVLARERRWFELTVILVLVTYFLIVSSGAQAYSRFRAPISPLLALLAGWGYASMFPNRRSPAPAEPAGQ
jgi:4-amino-4-deoxy-L-arabinose transferase-like glycosyltransferase